MESNEYVTLSQSLLDHHGADVPSEARATTLARMFRAKRGPSVPEPDSSYRRYTLEIWANKKGIATIATPSSNCGACWSPTGNRKLIEKFHRPGADVPSGARAIRAFSLNDGLQIRMLARMTRRQTFLSLYKLPAAGNIRARSIDIIL